ncbi:MAG: ATPase domain-containing protein [Bdellovibrionota bacterium]
MRTGVPGLDEVLRGGVRENNVILVEGAPGTGKTTLGLEFIYRGALEYGDPGLIVSFELSAERLLRDAEGFGWDLGALTRSGKIKIIFLSPAVFLEELQGSETVLLAEIKAIGAKRIMIDGLAPLRIFSDSSGHRPFRDSLHLLVENLQRYGVTAMVTNEISLKGAEHSASGNHERFVCDTIFTLSMHKNRRQAHRNIEVAKSRGQDFIAGQHTMRILGGEGVRVYRRTQSRPFALSAQPTSTRRLDIGVPALNTILGGGLYEGSITLCVGISGMGKTVLSSHFLMKGIEAGEQGLIVTLDEHPAQIGRNSDSIGLPLSEAVSNGKLTIQYDSPLELELDVHFYEIIRLIEKHKVKRVVLDSLAAYVAANREESMDFIYALASYFKQNLITAMFNYESPELLGVSQISENIKASHVVDNIVLLNYVEISTKIRRAITVPKARGSKNISRTREFIIGQGGISLLDEEHGDAAKVEEVPQLPFSSYYGILARSPARHSPVIDERLAHGEALPSSVKMNKAP